MLPAQQRLDAVAATGGQIDARLIDQAQLVLGAQCLGQGAEQGEGAAVGGVMLRIEIPAAAHFGAGIVGCGDQGTQPVGGMVVGQGHHPQAQPGLDGNAVVVEHPGQFLLQALEQRPLRGLVGVVQQKAEAGRSEAIQRLFSR